MRLQLVILLVLGALHAPAWGDEVPAGSGRATSRVLVYSDSDSTTVTTSIMDASVVLPREIELGAHALVDAVSTASIDVVSAATGRWTETRVEAGSRAGVRKDDVGVSAGFVRSQENDWLSHTVTAGSEADLFEDNTNIRGVYAFTRNKIGRAMDPNFERALDTHTLELSIGQLVDEKTRVVGAYTLQALNGFQSSPYRFVRAADGSTHPERHPDSRVRHALSGAVTRALSPLLASRARYRAYVDDWGVRSHTLSLRLAAEPREEVTLGVEARAYRQSRADFYFAEYSSSYRFMSFDRELSSFWNLGASADVSATLGVIVVDAKIGWIHYRFANFPALPKRDALVLGGGAKVEW